MKNLTWQNPEQLFVAQELINKVKSKCCGIKVNISYYCQKSFYDIVFCYLVFSFSMYILSWLVYYLYKRTVGLLIYKMFSYNIDCFRMKESSGKC